jgi:DinB superfamily
MIPMIGRPETTEAAPYYFTYINQVSGEDAVSAIENQLEESLAFFSAISEQKSLHRYAPDKWSIRQVLNHVNDAERVFALRALWFARGFDTPLPSFDQSIAVSGAEADRISWATHIEEFQRVRLATVSLFRSMPAKGWTRSGIASDNRFTVRSLAYIIPGHLTHHVKIIRERYL